MRQKREVVEINGIKYIILRCYGTYMHSCMYLVTNGKQSFVMNEYVQNHKVEQVEQDYRKLCRIGLELPRLYQVDREQNLILRQYVEGETADVLMRRNALKSGHLEQLRRMAMLAENSGFCLDYFPTNYVCSGDSIQYISYECIPWSEARSLDFKIKRYWLQPVNEIFCE